MALEEDKESIEYSDFAALRSELRNTSIRRIIRYRYSHR